ncbi:MULTISPECIES: glycosyltransferase [unclassified Streptomyces]|uniref:glycosyltransferase n=1 Tax=unclassified Streptomyces TaxID=2593676 RepID=UPI000F6EEB01|nr:MULTISPECIES: glycosyltransferase [unclassified Streptomyces]AZM62129.1 glycosyl transferase family 1 [Streptomyces sp. WAC 01438]RSN00047.1 glycosyl transferase family 1 [Streptomyces sp. WAC 01420]
MTAPTPPPERTAARDTAVARHDHAVTVVDGVGTTEGATWSPRTTALAAELAQALGTSRVHHVSTTATGGGVAELLWSSVAHHRSLGLRADWLVVSAPPEFFRLTKRVHHGLHGRHTGEFTPDEAAMYRAVTARLARQLSEVVRAGDLVILHDPQTVGMAPLLTDSGVRVAWRCHVGSRKDSPAAEATWELLRPFVQAVPRSVFSVPDFVPAFLPRSRASVIMPSIEPAAAKNRELSARECRGRLAGIGLTERSGAAAAAFPPAGHVVQDAPLPPDAPLVTQVSRWDPLKDMPGVLRAFAEHVAPESAAHLLLLGPDPDDIPDDPEGAEVFAEVCRIREGLAPRVRSRVHLAVLTLRDLHANGLVVNAAQRRSTVVVQKSLEEGFGLTLTEAMWKARPAVASAVGGLASQIRDGAEGHLVRPHDHAAFGARVNELLARSDYASRLGSAARRRCRDHFLAERELGQYLELYLMMVASGETS